MMISTIPSVHHAGSVRNDVNKVLVRLFQAPERLFGTLKTWQSRYEQRARLAQLSDAELSDMGISGAARASALAKPFWRG